MARKKTTGPTDGELAILSVLWQKGPSSVREVHEALHQDVETGYTTTLKLMQIMVEKGLLEREDDGRRTHDEGVPPLRVAGILPAKEKQGQDASPQTTADTTGPLSRRRRRKRTWCKICSTGSLPARRRNS